jgi:cold shock CspA family protein
VTDQHGHVDAYDPRRGLGSVERDDGHRFGFHCTAIADGSRDIPVGATVTFRIVPRHLGQWEAATIRSP